VGVTRFGAGSLKIFLKKGETERRRFLLRHRRVKKILSIFSRLIFFRHSSEKCFFPHSNVSRTDIVVGGPVRVYLLPQPSDVISPSGMQ
jgi:hypothetical protein